MIKDSMKPTCDDCQDGLFVRTNAELFCGCFDSQRTFTKSESDVRFSKLDKKESNLSKDYKACIMNDNAKIKDITEFIFEQIERKKYLPKRTMYFEEMIRDLSIVDLTFIEGMFFDTITKKNICPSRVLFPHNSTNFLTDKEIKVYTDTFEYYENLEYICSCSIHNSMKSWILFLKYTNDVLDIVRRLSFIGSHRSELIATQDLPRFLCNYVSICISLLEKYYFFEVDENDESKLANFYNPFSFNKLKSGETETLAAKLYELIFQINIMTNLQDLFPYYRQIHKNPDYMSKYSFRNQNSNSPKCENQSNFSNQSELFKKEQSCKREVCSTNCSLFKTFQGTRKKVGLSFWEWVDSDAINSSFGYVQSHLDECIQIFENVENVSEFFKKIWFQATEYEIIFSMSSIYFWNLLDRKIKPCDFFQEMNYFKLLYDYFKTNNFFAENSIFSTTINTIKKIVSHTFLPKILNIQYFSENSLCFLTSHCLNITQDCLAILFDNLYFYGMIDKDEYNSEKEYISNLECVKEKTVIPLFVKIEKEMAAADLLQKNIEKEKILKQKELVKKRQEAHLQNLINTSIPGYVTQCIPEPSPKKKKKRAKTLQKQKNPPVQSELNSDHLKEVCEILESTEVVIKKNIKLNNRERKLYNKLLSNNISLEKCILLMDRIGFKMVAETKGDHLTIRFLEFNNSKIREKGTFVRNREFLYYQEVNEFKRIINKYIDIEV